MPVGCFLDKSTPPTEQDIGLALGAALPIWQTLTAFIKEKYQMEAPLTFGGKNYGWNLWYRKSGKSLVSLYPQQGHFIAQVVLGREQVEKALLLPCGEKVGRLLRETPQLHDGKWLFIPVDSAQDLEDVQQLLLIKKRPIRQAKAA
jgi:hypothetical protein